MTSISLFSGMGGDSLGMKMANMDVVSFNEMDKYSIESHKINFPNCTLIEDNNKTNIIDISNEIFMKYKGNIDLIFAVLFLFLFFWYLFLYFFLFRSLSFPYFL